MTWYHSTSHGEVLSNADGSIMNECCCDGFQLDETVMIVFIDEARPTYTNNLALWNADVALFDAIYAESTDLAVACLVPGRPTSGVKGPGAPDPANITLVEVSRPTSELDIQTEYDLLVAAIGAHTNTYFLIDESGSMHRSTLEPGIDDFLASENPPGYLEFTFGTERWIWEALNALGKI